METYSINKETLNKIVNYSEFSIFKRELEPFEKMRVNSSSNRLLFETKMTEKMLGISEEDSIYHFFSFELFDLMKEKDFKDYFYFIPPIVDTIEINTNFKPFNIKIELKVFKLFFEKYIINNPNKLNFNSLNSIKVIKFANINIKLDETHKIIGEKISKFYHIRFPSILKIILEFESGKKCFMNGYNIELLHDDEISEGLINEQIKFNNHELVETCYKGSRITEICNDNGKNLRLENGYEIGIKNSIFGSTLNVGKYFWTPEN